MRKVMPGLTLNKDSRMQYLLSFYDGDISIVGDSAAGKTTTVDIFSGNHFNIISPATTTFVDVNGATTLRVSEYYIGLYSKNPRSGVYIQDFSPRKAFEDYLKRHSIKLSKNEKLEALKHVEVKRLRFNDMVGQVDKPGYVVDVQNALKLTKAVVVVVDTYKSLDGFIDNLSFWAPYFYEMLEKQKQGVTTLDGLKEIKIKRQDELPFYIVFNKFDQKKHEDWEDIIPSDKIGDVNTQQIRDVMEEILEENMESNEWNVERAIYSSALEAKKLAQGLKEQEDKKLAGQSLESIISLFNDACATSFPVIS